MHAGIRRSLRQRGRSFAFLTLSVCRTVCRSVASRDEVGYSTLVHGPFMSFFGRAARLTGAAVGGTSVVLFSQMWYVRMSFKLPPDASGPLQGVAHYEKPKGTLGGNGYGVAAK